MKLTLLRLHKELVGEQTLEHLMNMLDMTVLIWRKNEDIINAWNTAGAFDKPKGITRYS